MRAAPVRLAWWLYVLGVFLLLCVLPLLTAGCATVDQPRAITIPTNVAVAVSCDPTPITVPIWPTETLPPDAGMFERGRALLAELKMRRAYEKVVEAALEGCRGPGQAIAQSAAPEVATPAAPPVGKETGILGTFRGLMR